MAKMTTRRKLAIASWRAPHEPNIYGKLTVDAGPALKYIDDARRKSGEKITMTHFVGKATAEALKQTPSLNGRILFGKYRPHKTVDIAFLVSFEEGRDLAKAKVDNVDRKTIVEIARELRERSERLRGGRDVDFEKSTRLLRILPTWIIRPLVAAIGWLTGALGIQMKAFGLERFPFGSAIVTSVGMFGLDEGFVPPTPFARVPVYVLIGAVRDRPAVVDGKVVVQPQLTLTATIDHRFVDGFQGGTLAKVVRGIFEDPWSLDRAQLPFETLVDSKGGTPSAPPEAKAQPK
jgi:pyruvate dehydrogenase E2 component (dihydrolipoamide acetyltransferase)